MPLHTVATFHVTPKTRIVITHGGSILEFEPSSPEKSAIMNAANPTCIADFINGCSMTNFLEQSVQQAGGERLLAARLELPIVEGGSTRCEVGDAKLLGPNKYGKLPTNYVIDAVGPNYVEYDFEQYEMVDELLMSTFGSALERCKEHGLEEVAVSLVSTETRGKRSLKQILALSLSALGYWAQENQDTATGAGGMTKITVCCPTEKEADKMVGCGKKLGLTPEEEK